MLRILKKYIFMEKWRFLVYVAISIVTSISGILFPLFGGGFIDNLVAKKDMAVLMSYCVLLVFLSVSGLILGYVSNIIYIKLQGNSAYCLNYDLLEHIKSLPMSFWNDKDVVYLNQRVNNDSNNIIIFGISVVSKSLVNVIIIIFTTILLIRINIHITMLMLVLIIVYIIFYSILKKPLYIRSLEQKEAQNNYFARLNEQLSNVKFINLHTANSVFVNKLNYSYHDFIAKLISYQKISYLFTSFDTIVATLAQITLYIIGGIEVIKGTLTIGYFTILISYFKMLMGSVRYFYDLSKQYQDTLVSYRRIQQIKNQDAEINGDESIDKITYIQINNLKFAYNDKQILGSFNYEFNLGKIYGIIGKNGSGKSTFTDVLLGINAGKYEGNILINNIELKDLDLKRYRLNNIGITEQNPTLLKDTIYENLTLMNPKKQSFDKVVQLTKKFNLQEYIQLQPQGINTMINETATNLSGGEKQKIAIIRMLLQDPEVMIFDEPTSSLDSRSVEVFMEYIKAIKQDKIIIVITHDASFSNHFDSIIDFSSN